VQPEVSNSHNTGETTKAAHCSVSSAAATADEVSADPDVIGIDFFGVTVDSEGGFQERKVISFAPCSRCCDEAMIATIRLPTEKTIAYCGDFSAASAEADK
jgi:hypothetical protein